MANRLTTEQFEYAYRRAWEDLRKERPISGADARIMYHYMSPPHELPIT